MIVDTTKWSDNEVDDIVMGSGAETWPWYQQGIGQVVISPGVYGEYTVELGLDEIREIKEARFTRDDFRRVAAEVAEGKYEVRSDIIDYIRRNDLDADTVDVIIQIIAFGEVVFG